MTSWKYLGVGWLDTWTSECGRCLITRHPQRERGDHIILIDGETITRANTLELARYKASVILEGVES